MQAWERAAALGPEHKQLRWFAGRWREKVQLWMQPGQAPQVEQGFAHVRPVLGGRFMEMRHRGQFMGRPMQGIGFMGYDNIAGRYTSLWMDDGSTAMFQSTGTYDPATRTYTYTGHMADPEQAGRVVQVREVVRITGPDSYLFDWYETRDGKEAKTMQIDYTRVPGKSTHRRQGKRANQVPDQKQGTDAGS